MTETLKRGFIELGWAIVAAPLAVLTIALMLYPLVCVALVAGLVAYFPPWTAFIWAPLVFLSLVIWAGHA